jgi:hypothetical protein
MMKGAILTSVLLLTALAGATGQDIYGSPYSYYGIGQLVTQGAGINAAKSGTGIGSRPWYDLNIANPAAYTSPIVPSNYIFLADYAFSFHDFTYGNSQYTSVESSITNLTMWFKPMNNLGLVAGMSPYSKMGYNINEVKNLVGYGNYNVLNKGTGGVNRYYVGAGYTVWKRLSFGFNANYLFGSLQRETKVQLDQLDETYARDRLSLGSFAFDFGLQYQQKFGKNNYVNIGGIWKKGTQLKTVQTNQLINAETSSLLIGWDSYPDDYITPEEYGLGMEVSLFDKVAVSGDFLYKDYSKAFLGKEVAMLDTRRFSGGVDWMPNPASQSYFGRAVVRAGFFYETKPWKLTEQQLAGYGVTGGLSFPLSNYMSRINLGFGWEKMGTTVTGKESVYTVSVGMSLHDRWFQKKSYD